MRHAQPSATGEHARASVYLNVTRTPDGRFCVAYTTSETIRRSYTASLEQVVRQAQRAGGIPIHTEDEALRQRCQDEALPLM